MKSPGRKRPLRREITVPEDVDLSALSERLSYVGSPEHKSTRSFAGHPRPRADASICDPKLANSQNQVTQWLRDAVRLGNVSTIWEGDFPRYVWHELDGNPYEARLVNREQGQYKGYPLRPEERPGGLVTN